VQFLRSHKRNDSHRWQKDIVNNYTTTKRLRPADQRAPRAASVNPHLPNLGHLYAGRRLLQSPRLILISSPTRRCILLITSHARLTFIVERASPGLRDHDANALDRLAAICHWLAEHAIEGHSAWRDPQFGVHLSQQVSVCGRAGGLPYRAGPPR
jgi:hypothetical protein